MNQLKCGFSTEIKTLAIGFENSESLFGDCLELIPEMPLDTSYSAKTRRRLWLNHEVHLRTGEISLGYQHDSIWNFCQKVYPGCDIGLISYGGSVDGIDSSGLIGWHRDHGKNDLVEAYLCDTTLPDGAIEKRDCDKSFDDWKEESISLLQKHQAVS